MSNLDSIQKKNQPQSPKINSYSPLPPQQKKSFTQSTSNTSAGKKVLRLILTTIVCVILALSVIVIAKAVNLSNKIFVGTKTSFVSKVIEVIKNASGLGTSSNELKNTNILLLGIGGEGHDGPYLTDTMIVAQIRTDLKEISLTSIPRDYLVQLPNLGGRKINAAFAEGYSKHKDWNEGGQMALKAAQEISGLFIPYFAVVDFQGFVKAVDKVGGIEINVERTFTDRQFPDDFIKDTKGYLPPITFTEGRETMGGERALQFARSRHAEGVEGSDFARSQRQQKVIQAFKNKVLGLNLITDAKTLNNLVTIFANHFHTNLDPSKIIALYNFIKTEGLHEFISTSLDEQTKLICPQILETSGAYVLSPCIGKTSQDIQNFFKNSFSLGKIYSERPVIWMGNSTEDLKLYQKADLQLTAAGLTVWEIAYSKDNYPQTIMYQVNPKPATAEYLLNTFKAKEVNLPPPGIKIDKNKVDIILILGTN